MMHNMKDEDAGYFKDSSQESMGIRKCYRTSSLRDVSSISNLLMLRLSKMCKERDYKQLH